MAVFNEPSQWSHTLGNNADVASLPDDTGSTTGLASLSKLFQAINQTPLSAGGIAPARTDFNALFKVLGDSIFYAMNGGFASYNAAYDYAVGRFVVYNNTLYKCIQANGASSTVVAPDSVSPLGSDYWKDIENQDSTSLIPNQLIVSPVPLTDANLHLLDGALLSGSGAYSEYVTMMGELYNADPASNIWTDENSWQTSVTNTGSCGKFVYDSVNNTLRLPKYDARYLKSTLSASDLGNLVNARAPNIIANAQGLRINGSGSYSSSGAFSLSSGSNVAYGGSSSQTTGNLSFDASNSNPIYSDSATTIDTDAVKVYYYIVLGTVSKTQIQIDIDNVMADVANKADKDFSNVTAPVQAFKDMSIGWGMPDYSSAIDITSYFDSANKTYPAPSKGFFISSVRISQSTIMNVYINSITVSEVTTPAGGYMCADACYPVNENDTLSFSIAITPSSIPAKHVYFVPCKGV